MESETKACPQCAETILAAAQVCKHCGSDFAAMEAANSGFPARRVLYLLAVAAFIISGWDLSDAMPGSSRQREGYALFYLSIGLFVAGVFTQMSQRRSGDTRSDGAFWGWTVGIGLVVLVAGLAVL